MIQPKTREDLLRKLREGSSARRSADNKSKVNSQMDRMLGVAGANRMASEVDRGMQFAKDLAGAAGGAIKKGVVDSVREPAEAARREAALDRGMQFAKDLAGAVGGAIKKGVVDSVREPAEAARREAASRKSFEESPFSESGAQARKDADALRNFDWQGAGQAALGLGGSVLDGLSDSLPRMPKFDMRSDEQRQAAADGPFGDGYQRRKEAKEIEAEVDAEKYAEAYDLYVKKARARGDNENTIMSPEEFVDEMSGTQQADDGLGRERVGPMVGAHEVRRNVGSFQEKQERPDGQARYLPGDTPLTLDGEVTMPSNQGDADNAGRLRDIISERKRRDPEKPLSAGLQAQIESTQRDPYSGAPMTEGSGKLVAPELNSDGSVGAKTYTRAIPAEIADAASQLPAAEQDMYIAQAMGVDLSQYPESQRQAVAQKFVAEKQGLADRGNMVAAYTDPKTGFFVDAEGNPILDADGKPRKSDVPLAYDEDGNLLPGSEAPVFIRSTEALKRGEQRKKFNARMQDARSSGNNFIMSFVSRNPETGGVVFDEAGFEKQFPGTLPADGPERAKAISQLTNMIERGRAVQQNRDRLGKAQMDRSPTYGPTRMMESLDQAATPEEAATIAMYFNRPDIAQMYQQQAMGDRAILAEEQRAKAAAEVRAAGRGGDVNIEGAGAGSMQFKNRLKSGQLAPGQMANELIANGLTPKESRRQEASTQLGISIEADVPADAALNAGNVAPFIEEALEVAVPETGYLDWLRSPPGGYPLPLDTFDTIRENFIEDTMNQLNLPSGKGYEKALTDRFNRRMGETGRKVEERGVGEADAEATMPPAGVGG